MQAQKHAVQQFLKQYPEYELMSSYEEVETGKRNDRPQLQLALAEAKKHKALIIIAKLDRLSRNAAFLLALQESDSGIQFVCCDMPQADRFVLSIMALIAQHEAETISKRTRDALAALKRQGKTIGKRNLNKRATLKKSIATRQAISDEFAKSLARPIYELRTAHVRSYAKLAECLNLRGHRSMRGGRLYAQTVKNVIRRLDKLKINTRPLIFEERSVLR